MGTFKTDVVQFQPGSAGTRTIGRASDGSLLFTDPSFASGITLSEIVSGTYYAGVLTVSPDGGAGFTSIQDAIDDVPVTASATEPYLILVYPGVYTENLTVTRDGVTIVGVGDVTITNSTADPTLSLFEDSDGVPRTFRIQNVTLVNDDDNACVSLDGSNTYASGTVTVVSAPLAAGDTITIGGIPLTGVAGTRTSGSDNFNASLLTTASLAAEIAIALNDPANSFAASIEAASASSAIEVVANVAGTAGNAITLAVVTTPGGGMTVSGANLSGGGGEGSLLGVDGIVIQDCNLRAESAGALQVDASIVNRLLVVGGSWGDSSPTSKSVFSQVCDLKLSQVRSVNDLEIAYDTSEFEPFLETSQTSLEYLSSVEDVLVNHVGAGELVVKWSRLSSLTVAGDREGVLLGSSVASLNIGGTSVYAAEGGTVFGSLTGSATAAFLAPLVGTVAFVASSSEVVTLPIPQPDNNYLVLLDCPVLGAVPQVIARNDADFTVSFSAPQTTTVRYSLMRL